MDDNSKQSYMMPQLMGPIHDRATYSGSVYKERDMVALQYQTTPHAIAELLPLCYQPADPPVVTVGFLYNDGVDFMAGRGYRIATFMVTARFDGTQDHIEGTYALVMFEDDTLPILLGRERLGVPKLYADISPIQLLPDGKLRCEASRWGHLLFGIEVDPLVKQDDTAVEASNAQPGLPLLGYKYIDAVDGPPDAAYPISTPSDTTNTEISLGQSGRLFFGDPDETTISFLKRILDALKTLPVQKVTGVSRIRSSAVLRGDLARRLR